MSELNLTGIGYVWLFCFIPELDKKFKQLRLERDPEHIRELYADGRWTLLIYIHMFYSKTNEFE